MTGPMKKCTGSCGRELPFTEEFYGRRAEGLRARCRDCMREYDRNRDRRGRKSREVASTAFPRLPSLPLVLAIDKTDERRRREFWGGFLSSMQTLRPPASDYTSEATALGLGSDELGVAKRRQSVDRMVYGWRIGERTEANFATVDKVLTNGSWLWWEVYNEETVRLPVVTVNVRRMQKKKNRADVTPYAEETRDGWRVRFTQYTTAERRRYGDLGPDYETLRMIEHVFTCEGREGGCEMCAEHDRESGRGEQLELAAA